MAKLRGFATVTDNVVRRQEYERRHPAATIAHHKRPPPWYWTATWTEEGSHFQLTDHSLGGLLDQLDSLDLA